MHIRDRHRGTERQRYLKTAKETWRQRQTDRERERHREKSRQTKRQTEIYIWSNILMERQAES